MSKNEDKPLYPISVSHFRIDSGGVEVRAERLNDWDDLWKVTCSLDWINVDFRARGAFDDVRQWVDELAHVLGTTNERYETTVSDLRQQVRNMIQTVNVKLEAARKVHT